MKIDANENQYIRHNKYQELVCFLSTGVYPSNLQDTSTKAGKNKRESFRSKSKKFILQGELLYRHIPGNINGAQVVKKNGVNDILTEFHGSAFGGHSGINKTIEAIKCRYWWLGITDDVRTYVKSCEPCQRSDPLKPAKKPELQQIKVSSPFELVGVDLVGPLNETTSGNRYIFTATDYYTKWVEAFAIPSKSAKDVSRCFIKLVSRHGAMNAVLTDQGREFVNKVNDQLCNEWNIKHKMTAAYHPQTNGLDERTNQTLKTTLRKLVNDHQTDWDDLLDGALFAQRTKPQSTTKYSPFYLLYGREAVYPSQLPKDFGGDNYTPINQTSEEEVNSYVEKRQNNAPDLQSKVQANIQKAQQKQKQDYKKKVTTARSFVNLSSGDQVLLYNAKKAGTKSKGNLTQNYNGPYTIDSIKGKTVTLKNMNGQLLKRSVNIDKLKPFTTTITTATTTTTTDSTPDTCDTLPTKQLDQFLVDITTHGELQQLIDIFSSQPLPKPANIFNLQNQLASCPLQSFIAEVSKECNDQMDHFATNLLPSTRHLDLDLSTKTTLTMVLACVCAKAESTATPVLKIADTLKAVPSHLKSIGPTNNPLVEGERLYVGGECITTEDLTTLDEGGWLNDKVINAFIGLLKQERNVTDTHMFVLPSYTAVLWSGGDFGHWMFKRVQLSLYQHVLMPINVNGNHWGLMVVDMTEKTVSILDSMHGEDSQKFAEFWKNFINCRNMTSDVAESVDGLWTTGQNVSNKQMDGSSCGIFTLMNAECVALATPVHIMRHVHAAMYRKYVKERLLNAGTKAIAMCAMPGCTRKRGKVTQCSVCGRWLHVTCSVTQEDECVICTSMNR